MARIGTLAGEVRPAVPALLLTLALLLPAVARAGAACEPHGSGAACASACCVEAARATAGGAEAARAPACGAHAVCATACDRHAVVAASSHVHDHDADDADDDGFQWALYDPRTDRMNGGSSDYPASRLRRVARHAGHEMLWFERDGREWVTTDPALVARARAALAPMEELGRQMGRVGREQGAVGARLGRHGGELGRLGARQGALAARLATVSLREDLDDEDLVRARHEIRREMRELEIEMERVRDRMDADGDGGMERLGARMGELGRRMGELGRQAERTMRALGDEAVRTGRARRFDDAM
jgi:hypothetical protein